MRVKHGSIALKLLRPFTPENKIKLRMQQTRYGTLDKMLVIIPENKVLYTVIPKSANSTVKRCLWHACGVYLDPKEAHSTVQKDTGPTKRVTDLSDPELVDIFSSKEWFRFTFVRNPYSRLLSAYRDKIVENGDRERQSRFLERLGWRKNTPPTFDEFAQAVCDQDEEKMDWHWMVQSRLMMPELIPYSFVGRVENFAEGMKPILTRMNVSVQEQEDLLSSRINDSFNLQQSAGEKVKPTARITVRTVENVYLCYKKDFESFGYERASYDGILQVE